MISIKGSDFRRQISAVKYRRFLNLTPTIACGCIFGRAPQRLGRGVESINGLVGSTARVVRARRYLLAFFGSNWVGIDMWHRGLLDEINPLARVPFRRSFIRTS